MNETTQDKVQEENNPNVKQLYWNIAFGLQDVDGLKPSQYMRDLSEEHISGKKTYKQVQNEITSYYSKNKDNHEDDLIEETLKYDFNEEKDIDYSNYSEQSIIERITEFTCRIWQVHPF